MDGSIAQLNSEQHWQRFARPAQGLALGGNPLGASLFEQILSLPTPITVAPPPAAVASESKSILRSPNAGDTHDRPSRSNKVETDAPRETSAEDEQDSSEVRVEGAILDASNVPLPSAIVGEATSNETLTSSAEVSIDATEGATAQRLPAVVVRDPAAEDAAANTISLSSGQQPKNPSSEIVAVVENDAPKALQSEGLAEELTSPTATIADAIQGGPLEAKPESQLAEQLRKGQPALENASTSHVEQQPGITQKQGGQDVAQSIAEVGSPNAEGASTADAAVEVPSLEGGEEALQTNTQPTIETKKTEPEIVRARSQESLPANVETQEVEQTKPLSENQAELSPIIALENQPVADGQDQLESNLEQHEEPESSRPTEPEVEPRKKWYETHSTPQQRSEHEARSSPRFGAPQSSERGLASAHAAPVSPSGANSDAADPSTSVIEGGLGPDGQLLNSSTTVHNIVADPLATGVSAATLIAEAGFSTNDVSSTGVEALSSTTTSRRASLVREPAAGPVARPNDLTQQEQARLIQRISRSFSRLGPTGGEINLRLHPPQLGALSMQVRLEGRSMTAKLTAESTAARDAILEGLPILRGRLAEQGFDVSQFQVDVADNNANAAFSGKHGQETLNQHNRDSRTPHVDYRRVALANHAENQEELEPSSHRAIGNWATSRSIDVHA